MKAIEQYFPVVLFIMLYKVVLTFESVDEILKCDHLNKNLVSSTFAWNHLFFSILQNEIWDFTYFFLIFTTLGI